MLRYVISFPGDMTHQEMAALNEQLRQAAGSREWRDIIMNRGGTIKELAPRARRRLRYWPR
jgi:hypothetical protein